MRTYDCIHYYNLTPIAEKINSIINQNEKVTEAIVTKLSVPYFYMLYNIHQSLKYQLETVSKKCHSIFRHEKKNGHDLTSVVAR